MASKLVRIETEWDEDGLEELVRPAGVPIYSRLARCIHGTASNAICQECEEDSRWDGALDWAFLNLLKVATDSEGHRLVAFGKEGNILFVSSRWQDEIVQAGI